MNYRTNNQLVQTFGVNNLNELTSASRSGTLTVAGTATEPRANYWDNGVTSVTVSGNGLASGAAELYADGSWARSGATPADGQNTYTASAEDTQQNTSQDSVTVNLPASPSFSYDGNGNLLSDGQRYFEYDWENQLTNVYVSGQWRSEFAYDGLMRRRVRKEFTWSGGAWVKTNEVRYVYDGRLVLQERDSNNVPLVSYTRGKDLSGELEEAGGIGGLLARTDVSASTGSTADAYYHCDGNGNVTFLMDYNNLMAARYSYDPYGNILAMSGPLASVNLYRFSSKEYHANSGTVYYLYRFYDPNLQRWLNRDPLGDIGSLAIMTAGIAASWASDASGGTSNEELVAAWRDVSQSLFGAMGNSPLNLFDPFGLSQCHVWDIHDEKDPDPTLADINKRSNEQADKENAKMLEDLNKVKREAVKAVGMGAASEALGAEMAARATAGKFLPRVSQALFGKGGWLNSNRYLRVGFSRDGGRKVFRIAGDWIGKIKKDPHIVIKDCGPL